MYYRKYFEGVEEAQAVTKYIRDDPDVPVAVSVYPNQTNTINRAVAEVLNIVGATAVYDEDRCLLTVQGLPMMILMTYPSNWDYHRPGTATYMARAASTFGPFNGANYKFYVTVRGDPEGVLQVYIGSFNTPTDMRYGFVIGKGVDLRDNSEIRIINALSLSMPSDFFLYKIGGALPQGVLSNRTYSFGYSIANAPDLNLNGGLIPLIENIDSSGLFKLNNCYFGQGCLGANAFYNIGGDIYFSYSPTILQKCVTAAPKGA